MWDTRSLDYGSWRDYCILSFGPVKRSWVFVRKKNRFLCPILGSTLTQLMKESYVAYEGVGLFNQKLGSCFTDSVAKVFPRRWFNRMV